VDANYKFITVDIGGFGKQNVGGVFLALDLFSFIDGKIIFFFQNLTFSLTAM
jgi:hypothetical protein